MILIDSGPLVALLNRRDAKHRSTQQIATSITEQTLSTTWACFTETMHFAGRRVGFSAQYRLWRLVEEGQLELLVLSAKQIARAAALMRKYHDLPMDLADATLVAIAEDHPQCMIFTLDSHFQVYRTASGAALSLV